MNWITWLQTQQRNPKSPARLAPGSLGAITGQDARALAAIDACWNLYAGADDNGQAAAVVAVRALLRAMQPGCRVFARELIARSLDWDDRERLWPQVAGHEPIE